MTVFITWWEDGSHWDLIGVHSTREGAYYAIEQEKLSDGDYEFEYGVTEMEIS